MAETSLILETLVKGTEDARKKLNGVTESVNGIGESSKQVDKLGDTLKKNAAGFAIIATAAAAAFYAITRAGSDAIDAATQQQNALLGLGSIVRGTGNDFQKAQDFIDTFTQDGLVGVGDASTSLKNLLSRGFGLDEAADIMNRFKDSASFGRQESLGMGEAIRGATEGLKNENSILVDNAGVTKNVSQMWKEYAEKIGVGVQSLTIAQKREAEYQGILEETKHQVGDAAKMSDSYAGAQARNEAATQKLKVAIGTGLQPAMEAFYTAVTPVIIALTQFAKENPQIVSGVIILAGALAGLVTAIAGLGFVIPAMQAGWAALTVAWTYISTVAIPYVIAALGAISAPVWIVIAAVTALVAAGIAIWKNWDAIKAKAIEVWGLVSESVVGAWNAISAKTSEVWGSIMGFLSSTWNGIVEIFKLAVQVAAGIVIGVFDLMGVDIVQVFKNLYTKLSNFWETTKLLFQIGIAAISIAWSVSWGLIKDKFLETWNTMSTFLSETWGGIKGKISDGLGWMKTVFTQAFAPIKSAWDALWAALGSSVGLAWDNVKKIIKDSINSIITMVNKVITAVNKLASSGATALGMKPVKIDTITPLAEGGIVKARPGGILANIGEGGEDEAVIPLSKMNGMGMGGGITINITGTFGQGVAEEIGDMIVSKLARASYI